MISRTACCEKWLQIQAGASKRDTWFMLPFTELNISSNPFLYPKIQEILQSMKLDKRSLAFVGMFSHHVQC